MTRETPGGWSFDGFGPDFDGHVAAHLPGYMDAQRLVGLVAQFRLPPGGVIADYGASTGRTVEVIADTIKRPFTAHLYDADPTMLAEAAARVPRAVTHRRTFPDPAPLEHPPADMSLALWFLQFIPPQQHQTVLAQIRAGAAPGSVLIVASKTRHPDSRWEEIAVGALDDYKADQGVTPEQRAAKTAALRGTMHPLDTATLHNDLDRSGWVSPVLLWRWHVWSIFGAFAGHGLPA